MNRKEQLVQDIENLLNTYNEIDETFIDPDLLAFMDETTLISIIDSLLIQKEDAKKSDIEWLNKFKKEDS